MQKDKKTLEKEYTTARVLLRDLLMISREEKMVFRGVSDFNQLNPGINRVYSHNANVEDLAHYEFDLLHQFKKYSTSYLNGNLDVLDIVAYAQHFGLPTRLIDWTRNPFVALYFAVSRSEIGKPVYLFYTYLNQHTLINRSYAGFRHIDLENGAEFVTQYKQFVNSLKDLESLSSNVNYRKQELWEIGIKDDSIVNKDGLVFYECNASNPRLIAQQGLFSVPVSITNNDAKNEILRSCEQVKIIFPRDEKNELLTFLNNMNYNGIRLFPDIQSICSNIVQDHMKLERQDG